MTNVMWVAYPLNMLRKIRKVHLILDTGDHSEERDTSGLTGHGKGKTLCSISSS